MVHKQIRGQDLGKSLTGTRQGFAVRVAYKLPHNNVLRVQQTINYCFISGEIILLIYILVALMMRIEDVVVKTIIAGELHIASACKMFMPSPGNCFGKPSLL